MKRGDLLRHLRQQGCYLKREGAAHSLWCNPVTGHVEAIPRHTEISNNFARKICRNVSVDDAIERLVFLAKIDAGLAELDEGKGIPHGEVKQRLGM